jgi:hypothetical protein
MAAVPTFAFAPGCVQMALTTVGLAPAPHSGHRRTTRQAATNPATNPSGSPSSAERRKVEPIKGTSAAHNLCTTNATAMSCCLELHHPSAGRIETPLQLLLMYCL